MTTAHTDLALPWIPTGVYPPQEDSRLLVDVMWDSGLAADARVADLCTGSGVVAISAAAAGASSVHAFEICPRAVHCARINAAAAGAAVHVHRGSWTRAAEFGPFDLIVSNPPYVPHGTTHEPERIPVTAGPAHAWNAGPDGRAILDPLCAVAPRLLATGGSLLLVHSELCGVDQTLHLLAAGGLSADVVGRQRIPFGPVLSARAGWLERRGLLKAKNQRFEELVVIRADKP